MAVALTEAQIELASSLIEDEIPAKLRCAICSKLAINAFRLPCCETAICQNCQSTLPPACPVCEHSPVSGDDCTVYKSLRTTIRVFLKTEEKKRETARPKTSASTPTTPAEPTQTPIVAKAPTEPPVAVSTATPDDGVGAEGANEQPLTIAEPGVATTDTTGHDASAQPTQDHSATNEAAQDVENTGASEEVTNGQDVRETDHADDADGDVGNADDNENADTTGPGSVSESMNGSFNGMPFGNGDMNQMQMMMAMQNGMNPAAFGSFPMMGMGMGIDPMTMQNMFMNGGFGAQGMGMNGMNMNMGMNGFGGGNNDWNGQQSWNIGQDNFNPNAAGMGNGDFGNYNSGFRTGYNSGNYGHPNQFSDYSRGGYGYRGRGRGRGFYRGYGRGSYQGYNSRYGQNMWAQEAAQHTAEYDNQAASNETESLDHKGEGETSATTDEFGRRLRPDTEQEQSEDKQRTDGADQGDSHGEGGGGQQVSAPHGEEAHGDAVVPNGDVSSADAYANTRGTSHGPGSGSMAPVAAPDVPLNAPTGPKAMRQGLPNTSALHLRARGLIQDERSSMSLTNAPMMASPIEARPASRSSSRHSTRDTGRHSEQFRDYDDDRDESRDDGYDEDPEDPRSHSKGRSHSQSRDRKESRRHRRHHSESASADDREDDYRRRKYKSRRSTRDEDDHKGRSKDDKYDDRSRSISPDRDREHRRSSHRSHRDRDKDKDKDRDEDYDRHRKSSHRSHHDYDRDRDREKDRDMDRPKDRTRDRDGDRDRDYDRDRERDSRRSSRKTPKEEPASTDAAEKEFNPPTGPRSSLSIKGASYKANILELRGTSSKSSRRGSESSRRASQASVAPVKSIPSGPSKDVHTLEREARDRERLLKEAQRMAGLAGLASLKRGRGREEEQGGRRKSRRSEAVYDDENRLKRLEAEREGGRWD